MIDRIKELKGSIRRKRMERQQVYLKPHYDYLEGFYSALHEPFELREAKARFRFYQNAPIFIAPGEAIVGQVDWNEPLVCLIANTHIRQDVLNRILESGLPEAETHRVKEMIETVRPFCFNPWPHLTEEEKRVQNSHLAPSTFFNGHMVPDYGYVLQRGIGGVMEDIQRYRRRPLSIVERNFYDAMEMTAWGLSCYINRYGDLAQALLEAKTASEQEGDERPALAGRGGFSAQKDLPAGASIQEYDIEQLRHIETVCHRLACEPARNFPEALQMIWFWMCFVDYDSFGRTDQYLLPYYEMSRVQGMTDEEALLWMKYTWIKIEECGAILNMTIGGRKSSGESAVNPLTILALQATRQMGFRSPNLSLRIRANDPEELWKEAHTSLATGQGLPALYNDDLIVPMLTSLGYPEYEALDYCLAGCSQVILPGRSNFACDVGAYNLLKALELALHDGYDVLLGEQVGPKTGSPDTLDTYEKLKQAYDQQMRYMTRLGVSINDKDMYLRQREGACVRSLTTRDCLERGQGFFHGGARYYNIQNEACGITNTANALYALKELVYEKRIVSLAELVRILDANWEGQETLRLHFKKRCQKFGNDADGVDVIRAQISAEWYGEIQQYPAVLGGFHWPGEVVFVYHEIHGAHTAATPDGRKRGEPMANSAGASAGTDVHGPSALLNSMLKIPQAQCLTCCVLNLRFSRKTWSQDPEAVISLLRSYFLGGGFQVQVNLVSRDELLAARQNPDQYADLVVRVGGFSDYYVRLSPALQEEILERTEHEL